MAGQRIHHYHPDWSRNRGLHGTVASSCQVVTNIRRANVSGDRGWVILEISESDKEITRALDWAKDQGVRIDSEGEHATGVAPCRLGLPTTGLGRAPLAGESVMSVRVQDPGPAPRGHVGRVQGDGRRVEIWTRR